MKKSSLITMSLAFVAISANASVFEKAQTSKKVNDFKILNCFASGDLALEENYKTHKAFDFCKPDNVNLILTEAKNIKSANFAGDLKLIKLTPKQKPKHFIDYALVVVVDEKDKLIMPSSFAYGVVNHDKKTSSEVNKKLMLGQLYSTPKSFMFTFENPFWEKIDLMDTDNDVYKGYSLYLSEDDYAPNDYSYQNYLQGMFLGIENNVSKFNGNVVSESEQSFSITKKVLPEKDKQLMKALKEYNPIKYRTFDTVMKMNGNK